MINLKKLLLITICVTMFFSCIPVLGAEEVNTFLEEDFNSDITGDMPVGSFKAQKGGGAELGVVEVPDAKNKSVYLRGADGGMASLAGAMSNPDYLPITVSFRFMLPSEANVSLPVIKDAEGITEAIFTVSGRMLKRGERDIANLETKRWYYTEITFDFTQKTYRISLDGEMVTQRFSTACDNIELISFEATGNNSGIYLDDVRVAKTTVGSPDREWWPTQMWVGDAQQMVVDDIALGNFLMFHGSTVAYKNGEKFTMPAPVREIDTVYYIPLRFAAEKMGAEVVWNEVEKAVYMMFLGKTIKVSADESKAYTDDAETVLTYEIKSIDGTTYISAKDLGTLLQQEVNFGDGLIMFGSDWDYYKSTETAVQTELKRMVKYQRPDGETIYNTLVANNPDKRHPRVLGNASDFERLRGYWQTDEFAKKAFDYLQQRADEYMKQDVTPYVDVTQMGTRNHSARKVSKIIYTCSMMYHLKGDVAYAERARAEVMNVVENYPELGELSVLDLGDSGEFIGIAYDWLYNYLSEEDKAKIRNRVYEQVLKPYLSCYRGGIAPYEGVKMNWAYTPDNMNSHLNQGAIMCLLSMGDDFDAKIRDEYVKPILNYAFRSMENFLDEWYPDGGWVEGPGYGTAVIYQLAFIIDAIGSACGTTFGYDGVPGLFESGIWALHMEGPKGSFNYGDSQAKDKYHQPFFWLSETLDENIFASKRKVELEEEWFSSLWAEEMLWYNPARCQEYTPPEDNDKYFRRIETVAMRSGWGDDDLYAGLHAGENGARHSHIDTGSMVLDWAGTRWIEDLGLDRATYTSTNDWGTFYRTRAEGHNTIVIDDTPYIEYEDGEWPVIFSEDFENFDVNSDPTSFKTSETTSDPNGQGEVGVVNVETVKKDGNSQNKAMRVAQNDNPQTGFYAERNFGTNVEGAMEISFKYMINNITPTVTKSCISFYSPKTDTSEATWFYAFDIQGGNTLRGINGSGRTPIGTLTPGQWHDIKLVVDIKNDTINIKLDDKEWVNGLKMAKPVEGVNRIRLTSTGSKMDYDVTFDDFEIRINPDEKELANSSARLYDQTTYCFSPITDFVSKPRGSYAITDMTPAYKMWASDIKRGIKLTDNRNTFVVRDEMTLLRKSDVYWFAHSAKSDVKYTISPDRKSAILEALNKGVPTGVKMWAEIISDTPNAEFQEMACEPMEGSPTPSNQADNSGYQKLAVKLAEVEGKVNIEVAFVPLSAGKEVPDSIPKSTALNNWSIPDGEIPALDTLTLNGVQIENFEATKTNYSIVVRSDQAVPQVAATYKGESLAVEQASSLGNAAVVTLMDAGHEVRYRVNFIEEKVIYAEIQGHKITDADIFASSTTAAENGPAEIIDKNMETSCSSLGDGEYVIFDFGQVCDFSKIEIAWRWGEGRNYKFDLLYSNDGVNWETAYTGASSGVGSDYELYEFGKTINAKLLKLVGHGNNQNLYNNMLEIR